MFVNVFVYRCDVLSRVYYKCIYWFLYTHMLTVYFSRNFTSDISISIYSEIYLHIYIYLYILGEIPRNEYEFDCFIFLYFASNFLRTKHQILNLFARIQNCLYFVCCLNFLAHKQLIQWRKNRSHLMISVFRPFFVYHIIFFHWLLRSTEFDWKKYVRSNIRLNSHRNIDVKNNKLSAKFAQQAHTKFNVLDCLSNLYTELIRIRMKKSIVFDTHTLQKIISRSHSVYVSRVVCKRAHRQYMGPYKQTKHTH